MMIMNAELQAVEKAHIVWMCHLDVGYTNSVASVVNTYFHDYFPKAIKTANLVNKPGQPPVFKFTTHAWLLDMFFDCPHRFGTNCSFAPDSFSSTPDYNIGCILCPNATLINQVQHAIDNDIITWHAFPFNAEAELGTSALIAEGFKSVHRLDDRFGKPHKKVMSQRDVPGTSWFSISLSLHACPQLAFSHHHSL